MIQLQVREEMTAAMKARDKVKLETLRGLSAAFVNELVATKRKPTDELPDNDALGVIRREVKKRREAAEAFRSGGREESAVKEDQEREILEGYLPPQMSEDEVRAVVEAKKTELGISDKKDTGRLMGAVMGALRGKAGAEMVKNEITKALG